MKTTLSLVGSGRGRGSADRKFTMVLMERAGDRGEEIKDVFDKSGGETKDVFGKSGGEYEAEASTAVAGDQGEEGTGDADKKVAKEEINALCDEYEQQEGEHEVELYWSYGYPVTAVVLWLHLSSFWISIHP